MHGWIPGHAQTVFTRCASRELWSHVTVTSLSPHYTSAFPIPPPPLLSTVLLDFIVPEYLRSRLVTPSGDHPIVHALTSKFSHHNIFVNFVIWVLITKIFLVKFYRRSYVLCARAHAHRKRDRAYVYIVKRALSLIHFSNNILRLVANNHVEEMAKQTTAEGRTSLV